MAMSCPPHTSTCGHRNEYKAQLRASIESRKAQWRTVPSTNPRPGVADPPLDESSDDDSPDERPPAEHGRCPPGRSSTKQVRRSETTCLASRTRQPRTPSPPLLASDQRSCRSVLDPLSHRSSSTFGTPPHAPPKIPPDSVAVKSTCPFARRNRYMPLGLRNASHWKPTIPRHGNGEGSASLQRMISENGTQIPLTSFDEHPMEWSDS